MLAPFQSRLSLTSVVYLPVVHQRQCLHFLFGVLDGQVEIPRGVHVVVDGGLADAAGGGAAGRAGTG